MSAVHGRSTSPGDLASVLDAILRRHGLGLLENAPRLFALLRDYAPDSPRDIRVLMTALESGAPDRLRAGPASEATLTAETARMVDLYGCHPPLARAALETWSRSIAGSTAGSVRPLPASPGAAVQPLPLPLPLPLPGSAPTIQPLPGSAPHPVRPLPLPASSEPDPPKGWFARWAPTVGAVLLLIAAAVRLLGQL